MYLPSAARVVIISGDVAGSSIAYHLALGGWSDVIVLDRHELTSGATFHSAGLVGQLRSSVGMELEVDIFGERLPAKVESEPLYNPRGARIRS